MTNNETTALIESWKPMPEVLRGYAKDMDTNTRLIDGDIAPYLRKVADWIEALAAFGQPTLRMVGAQCSCGKQMTVTQEYPFEQPAVREMTEREFVYAISDYHSGDGTEALEIARAIAKLGTIRVVQS